VPHARLPLVLSFVVATGCAEGLSLDSADFGGFLASAKDTGPAELFVGDLSEGDLVINEVMIDTAAVANGAGEWFEIYNASGFNVDLDGLEVFDTSVGSPGSPFTVSGTLIVDADSYVVLGRKTTIATNGGADVDYAYGTAHVLGNASDELFLSNGTDVIDSIAWDNGATFPDPTGASISLDATSQDSTSNDDGAGWCVSRTAYGDGDLGTPGTANDSCTTFALGELAVGDLVINEIFKEPLASGAGAGEWFEIYNASGVDVDLKGLEIFDTDAITKGNLIAITSSVVVADGGLAVLGRNGDTGTNGGVTLDYAYGSGHTLGNGADEVFLGNGSTVLDSIAYDNGASWPDSAGASFGLAEVSQDATSNDDGANWCLAASTFGAGDLGTPGTANDSCSGVVVTTAVADLAVGDLIITELMKEPAKVPDNRGEWFEIYNRTGGVVNLDGLEIFDTSVAAQTDKITVSGRLLIAAGAYVVLGRYDDLVLNGGVTLDYEYGTGHTLGNGADETFLYNGTDVIDSVFWDNGFNFPDPTGASMILNPGTLDATLNDDGANWCVSSTAYGAGDLGTPGTANDSCALSIDDLTAGDLVITELMVDPDAVPDNAGEWMELYNATGDTIDLDGLQLFDTDVTTKGNLVTLSGLLMVEPGEYVVLGRYGEVGINGGVSMASTYGGTHTLGNASDELFLFNGTDVIDSVSWDNGNTFPDPTGASMTLNPDRLDDVNNDDGANWCAGTSVYGDGDLGTPGSANDACAGGGSDLAVGDLIEGDLIITEIHHNPVAVGDLRGEWIEVYNNTLVTIELDGLQIFDTSVGVMGELVLVSGSVPVLTGEYVVLGIDGDIAANGGVTVDFEYGVGHRLANFADEVFLYNGTLVIDQVGYDGGATFPNTAGASISLDGDHRDSSENDDGANWCAASSTFGSGDSGTPGSANDDCDAGPADSDGDGFTADVDCDDGAPAVNPAATEICDSIDNDCNGDIDDADSGVTGQSTWYVDADIDGYGSASVTQDACEAPTGYETNNLDCDDGDPNVHPGMLEINGDGIDQDCDGLDSYTYTYVDDVEPIFVGHCDGCHLSGAVSGDFNMDNGTSDHVNVASLDVPSMDLFEPGDTSQSYIWHKLNDTQGTVGGAGQQMPRGGPFLDAGDLSIIETWIIEGCPD
jgi:hypothetical protein